MDRAEMVRRGAEAAWRVDWPGAEWEFASLSAEDREWYGRVAEAVLGAARPATAREHLDAAWDAAHTPEDGMLPAEQLRALLAAYRDQDVDADDYEGRLSVYLARHGARVGEDR